MDGSQSGAGLSWLQTMMDVKSVRHHDLIPSSNKVLSKLVGAIFLGIDFGNGAEFGLRTEDKVVAGGDPLLLARLAVDTLEELAVIASGLPGCVVVEQVDEEVVGQLTRTVGEDTILGSIPVGVQSTHTSNEDGHFGWREVEQVGLVDEELLGADTGGRLAVIAEAIVVRLEVVE